MKNKYACIHCGKALKDDLSNRLNDCLGREGFRAPCHFEELPPVERPRWKGVNTEPVAGVKAATYADEPYHCWDWIADLGVDFFRGNMVKLLLGWRQADGVETLREAQAYFRKYQSVAALGKLPDATPRKNAKGYYDEQPWKGTRRLISSHDLKGTMEDAIITSLMQWDGMTGTLLAAFIDTVERERANKPPVYTPRPIKKPTTVLHRPRPRPDFTVSGEMATTIKRFVPIEESYRTMTERARDDSAIANSSRGR